MQTARKTTLVYWSTPAVGLLIGVVYLVAFWVGGNPGLGIGGFALLAGFSAAVLLAGRRSETVRGLLDHRDERIAGIDLRATAFTALVMIVAVLVGFVIEVGQGRSGSPYDLIGAVGGLAYLSAVCYLRVRK